MLLGAFGPFFTFSYQSSDSHPAPRTSDQSLTKSWISHLLAFRKDRSRFYQPAFFGSGFNYLRYFLVDSAYLLLISVGKRPKLAFIADLGR